MARKKKVVFPAIIYPGIAFPEGFGDDVPLIVFHRKVGDVEHTWDNPPYSSQQMLLTSLKSLQN